MRNDWYPKRMAEYMTDAQLRELGLENVVSERDSTFLPGLERQTQKTAVEETPIQIDLDFLSVC